jgi:hypothetical protein
VLHDALYFESRAIIIKIPVFHQENVKKDDNMAAFVEFWETNDHSRWLSSGL